MKIIYKKTILEKIDEEIEKAVARKKVIDKIILNKDEVDQIYEALDIKKGNCIDGYKGISLEGEDIKEQKPHQNKPEEPQPVPKSIPGAWVCDEGVCTYFINKPGYFPACKFLDVGLATLRNFKGDHEAACCKGKPVT